jgi:outer membrane biosynthesis protein TonB
MSSFGGMPRSTLLYSALFHVGVAGALYGLYHFHFFDRAIVEDTPLVVQLVNPAAITRATEVNLTPPKPEKPKEVAQAEPPKPEPPKPEPPPPPPPPPPDPAPKPPEPPPKPEPKPEPPKPAPAPPPPKPEPPKKKEEDVDTFVTSILKNVKRTRPSEQDAKQVATAEPKASTQPNALLGSQLSTSEIDLVLQQIYRCWSLPAGAKDARDLRPEFRVYMNADGTVRSATQLNSERNSDPFFRAAAESAMRALRNPDCSPLKLPPNKYDQWQTFTITFDPKDAL